MYRELMEGSESTLQLHKDFSKLFLDWCLENNVIAHLVSSHGNRDKFRDGQFLLENRPKPALSSRGGCFTISGNCLCNRLDKDRNWDARWCLHRRLGYHRLDFPLPFAGFRHQSDCGDAQFTLGLWLSAAQLHAAVSQCDKWFFFRHVASATVNVSPECERQVREVARKLNGAIYQCRAQYARVFSTK